MSLLRESSNYCVKSIAIGLEKDFVSTYNEYYTTLPTQCGKYYVTNRFDPRVVQWCKENNVVPGGIGNV